MVVRRVSTLPSFDPIREPGARTDNALSTPARSSPPYSCAAPARCGADVGMLLAPSEAGTRTMTRPSHLRAHRRLPSCCARALRRVLDERRIVAGMQAAGGTDARARPWSGRSPRGFRFGDGRLPWRLPARCGAFAD